MDIFTRLGIVEHTGHGVPVIVSRYGKDAFEISNSYIRVVIPFNNEVLLNHGVISGAISGVNRDNLGDKENEILLVIEKNPHISAKELSGLLNIPFRSVQRYISNLWEKGFIDWVGVKNGYWEVIKKWVDNISFDFKKEYKELYSMYQYIRRIQILTKLFSFVLRVR